MQLKIVSDTQGNQDSGWKAIKHTVNLGLKTIKVG